MILYDSDFRLHWNVIFYSIAFETSTGMPYGTVNLLYGVPKGETPVTCTAGVGTFIVEFGALSKLTGDPIFQRVALRALDALWKSRSEINLVIFFLSLQRFVRLFVTWRTIFQCHSSLFCYFAYLFCRPTVCQNIYDGISILILIKVQTLWKILNLFTKGEWCVFYVITHFTLSLTLKSIIFSVEAILIQNLTTSN